MKKIVIILMLSTESELTNVLYREGCKKKDDIET